MQKTSDSKIVYTSLREEDFKKASATDQDTN
jgi:hypothetical protein